MVIVTGLRITYKTDEAHLCVDRRRHFQQGSTERVRPASSWMSVVPSHGLALKTGTRGKKQKSSLRLTDTRNTLRTVSLVMMLGPVLFTPLLQQTVPNSLCIESAWNRPRARHQAPLLVDSEIDSPLFEISSSLLLKPFNITLPGFRLKVYAPMVTTRSYLCGNQAWLWISYAATMFEPTWHELRNLIIYATSQLVLWGLGVTLPLARSPWCRWPLAFYASFSLLTASPVWSPSSHTWLLPQACP